MRSLFDTTYMADRGVANGHVVMRHILVDVIHNRGHVVELHTSVLEPVSRQMMNLGINQVQESNDLSAI